MSVLSWKKNLNAVFFEAGAGNRFLIREDYDIPVIRALLPDFDAALEKSEILKDSRTTTAGLITLDGQRFFLKRTNNKGFKFTLRYLFRSARAFRSAAAAVKLGNAGILTPAFVAAGEKRSGLFLRAGYLITESEPRLNGLDKLICQASDPVAELEKLLPGIIRNIVKLHSAGILHGDLKLSNFYLAPQGIGMWDLDSVKYFIRMPRVKLRARELGRVISSVLMELDTQSAVPDSFFSPNAMAEKVCALYGNEAPPCELVAAFARHRWLHMPRRRRKEVDEV